MRLVILLNAVLVGALVASAETLDQTAPQPTGGMRHFLNGLRNRLGGYVQTDSSATSSGETKLVSLSDISSEIENLNVAMKGIETILGQLIEQIQQMRQQMHMQEAERQREPENGQGNPSGDRAIIKPGIELIKHPPPMDRYTKTKLIDILSGLDFHGPHQGELAEWVAEQLYDTMDKQTTELFKGVTVQALIDQNHMELKDCSQDALRGRSTLHMSTYIEKGTAGMNYGVRVYTLRLLHSAAEYCTSHQEEAVSQGINDAGWLRSLADAIRQDEEWTSKEFSSGTKLDEKYVQKASVPHMVRLIEGGKDMWIEKMEALRIKRALMNLEIGL